jgi:nitrite reductase/ring-hydroxylating ferredoxin subunit
MSGYRYPFPPYPDGWFSIGASDLVGPGDVADVHYLGRDLVVFRSEGGDVRVFDAHCPHLGAHLGIGGKVCGDSIVCPFHGWRFEGDGQVVEVPGLEDRKPPRISAKTWEVRELNDRIFIWYHALGEPPSYEPREYRTNGAEWTPWSSSSERVRIGLQDLSENIIDRSHFQHIHDMVAPENPHYEVTFEDQTMVVDQYIKVTAASAEGVEIHSRSTTCGPGVVAVEVQEGELNMLTYIVQTPVDDEITEISLCFSMVALDDPKATAMIAEMNDSITKDQFTKDIPIWENKRYIPKPPLTAVDGPVSKYRRWFQSLYSDWSPEQRDSGVGTSEELAHS